MEVNKKRENPYLAFSPCCGETICLQCVRLDMLSSSAADDMDGDMRYLHGLRYRRKKHIATYDHSTVDTSERVVMRMTIDAPAGVINGGA